MTEDALKDARTRMSKAIDALKRELATIRTGRANAGLVDHLTIDYYGTPTPLNQIATVAIPEARLITIQPWDRQALTAIERAIQKSDLGLNPSNDGTVIRLAVPQLTEERRRDLTRLVRRRVEEGRVAIRNIRRDCADELRRREKAKEISEDEHRRAQEQLEKLTHQFIADVDRLGQEKETEVMEV